MDRSPWHVSEGVRFDNVPNRAMNKDTIMKLQTLKRILVDTVLVSGAAMVLVLVGCGMGGSTAQAKPYPLDTCIVSGEKLGGEHGKPFVFVHEGQEIKLCCKSCQKDFKKDPAHYLKKLQDAEAAKKK